MNTPVSFEIDKLLLSKNIDMPIEPTIADVIMWMYDKHGIWISVVDNNPEQTKWEFQISRREIGLLYSSGQYPPTYSDTPTESYEGAIEYCLNNLI